MNNSKAISILFGSIVGLITTLTVFILGIDAGIKLVSAAIISFSTSTLLFAIITENLFDKKIKKIYDSFQKIRNKEFDTIAGDRSLLKEINPLKGINTEIFDYAKLKQLEIDELENLERYRKEFLQNVSHELKTPIFAAQGFVHTLLDNADVPEDIRSDFLKKAAKSLDHLDLLVKDLLTISQMESGDIKMKMENFDIISLIKESLDQLEPRAYSRNIKLVYKENENKLIVVFADYYRIYQVIKNLVTNSIKYSDSDSKVVVECEKRKKIARIIIKDKGKGIPKNDRKRIFERFYRVDKSRSKQRGGTGLGLAIVKHIIEGHNSKIKLSSKTNIGSEFSFNLKLAKKGKIKKKKISKILPKI